MSWDDILRRMLPPIDGVQPHITGPAGTFGAGEAEGRGPRSSRPHKGVDANYIGGRTARLNQSHPALHSPVTGVVENAGEGSVGRIAIRDKNGYLHELLHTDKRYVVKDAPVAAGQIIGTMGNTGTQDQHLHFQLKDPAGKFIDPTEFFDQQGPIDPNPAPPPYLDAVSGRAAQLFDNNAKINPRVPPPDHPGNPFFSPFAQPIPAPPAAPASQNPIADRFGEWASVPAANAPAASNDPTSFVDRFGKWDLRAPGAFGNVGAPAPQEPDQGKRSEADDAPVRVLSRVNLSAAPASGDAPPLSAASPTPLLGIFSGQPMRNYPVPPSIFQLPDRSAFDDDEWYQRWR